MALLVRLLLVVSGLVVSWPVALVAAGGSTLVSSLNGRLPPSLSAVVKQLQGQGCMEVATVCLLTSRGVTPRRRKALIDLLTQADQVTDNKTESEESVEPAPLTPLSSEGKALGTQSGMVLAQPESIEESVASACACRTILYYPDLTDLHRGEGLLDALAPAMEVIRRLELPTTLVVVVDSPDSQPLVKAKLERAIEPVLRSLVDSSAVVDLEEIFGRIVYTSLADLPQVLESDAQAKLAVSDATGRISRAQSASSPWPFSRWTSRLASHDLAAARILGPAAREKLAQTVGQVQAACLDAPVGAASGEASTAIPDPRLVLKFGQLCDGIVRRALQELKEAASGMPSAVLYSSAGKQILQNFLSDLEMELAPIWEEQLEQLEQAHFEEYKKEIAKLLISPNLARDMNQQVKKSIAALNKAVRRMIPTTMSSSWWSTDSAKERYRRKVQDHASNRLLTARANGQFRPLPRKGVALGFHWLFPKPFGNDFRQEPWMVHASDNMVYVPQQKKLADVNPEEVVTGDWRDKIVPSPAGNDMLYMQ